MAMGTIKDNTLVYAIKKKASLFPLRFRGLNCHNLLASGNYTFASLRLCVKLYSLICAIISIIILTTSACKKTEKTSYSKFKTYTLDFYPGAAPISIKQTDGTFVIILGGGNNDSNFHFLKFDSHGNFITSKSYNFYLKSFNTMAPVGNGFFIAGSNNLKPGYFMSMFDNNMNKLWDTGYNFTDINSLAGCAATDGNILITFGLRQSGATTFPTYIAKINTTTGALIYPWKIVQKITGGLNFQPTGIFERSDGVYINGYYYFYLTGNEYLGNYFCLNTTETGGTKWSKYHPKPDSTGKSPHVLAYGISDNPGGSVAAVTITLASLVNDIRGSGAVKALSFDPTTGNELDSAIFSIDTNTWQPIIHSTPDSGYIIAATGNFYENSPTVPTTVLLIKTDTHFNVQWQKKFDPGGSYYFVYGLYVLSDGYEIIGINSSIIKNVTKEDIFFMKTDLNGNLADK
jgi:hypothetical protein